MSSKGNNKSDVLKKIIARLVKNAPAKRPEPEDPLWRMVRAFLEYDCDQARSDVAERKIRENMVDLNELRVTPAIEVAAILGVRYPFAEARASALHRTLQSIFDREHQMKLDRLNEMKKPEIRPYLQGLTGITPYVEAAVAVECFGVAAAPVDTKLLLWLISKDALPEGTDIRTAQQIVEKHLKASEALDFHLGARKEIDAWSPKVWPAVAKTPSPVLPPPPLNSAGEPMPIPQEAKPAADASAKKPDKTEKSGGEKKKDNGGKGKLAAAGRKK